MRNLITILLLIISSKLDAQLDSLVWNTNSEKGVINYTIQKSYDKSVWTVLGNVYPKRLDSNYYSYALPTPNYYYRIVSNMFGGFTYKTSPDFLPSALPVNLTNISVQGRNLRFTSNNENNLDSYLIYESIDGLNWVEIIKIVPKGNSEYKIVLQ